MNHEPPPGEGPTHAPPPAAPAAPRHGALVTVSVTVVVTLAFVGYTFGTRPAPEPPRPTSPLPSTEGAWVPGQRYDALRDRRYGEHARVSSDVAMLRKDLPGPDDVPAALASPAERAAALAERAARRAYDGAPPTIPHAVDQQSAGACLVCHGEGMAVAGKRAPVIPHARYTSCTQCHVPGVVPTEAPPPLALNTFAGLASYGAGTRAWAGAPPTIPHPTWMREACASCHGPLGTAGLRTPHPRNVSCEQCHAPNQAAAPSGVPPFARAGAAR